jgi:xyloglucan-specific exo-beta-1,4-glucanase
MTLRLMLILLLALLWPAGTATAQDADYVWRNVTVGGGGFIPGVVFSEVEPGLAYARSDMGGAYRFDAQLNRWVPLQDGVAESSFYGVESIAPDPVDPDVVYAAVGMHRGGRAAILRSADRGETWSTYPVDFPMGGNEDGRGLGERLAIDPNDTAALYFGSRHHGLQRSADHGRTWRRVERFPHAGLGVPARGEPTHPGISFVLFDGRSGAPGHGSSVIVAGVADEGAQGLDRTDDGGRTWRRLDGGPDGLSPVKGVIDQRGVLYTTWTRGVGPNGVTDGAVWRLDLDSGDWRDITPPHEPGSGGFMGVDVARDQPGVVMVSTLNRWRPGDTLWRTTDDGASWTSLREQAVRDVSDTPFLYWGRDEPDFGWWIAALAIDPFDADHMVYGTGATLYATRNLGATDQGAPTRWRPWVAGIEQTAVITLVSPREGPPLLTGFGDISGFAHEDMDVSPRLHFTTPVFGNTNVIDYAWHAPEIVVRSGTPHEGVGSENADGSTLAWSEDHGRTWRPLGRPAPAADPEVAQNPRMDLYRDAPITVSADGETFVVATPRPILSRDRGATWRAVQGLPVLARPVADRHDPLLFYALDFGTGDWFVSVDGAATFAPVPSRGLPDELWRDQPHWREIAFPLRATPGRDGDLWFVSTRGLFRSIDGGQRFERIDSDVAVRSMDFGAPMPGRDYPALYAIGERDGVLGIYRSDDAGRSWLRVNDDQHEYGRRYRAVAGDPRIPGRVYVATDGRGVVYGEPR